VCILSLDGDELSQVNVDIGEVLMFGLLLLEQLNNNSQSLLSDDVNRVDRGVQGRDLVIFPLFRLGLLNTIADSLLEGGRLSEDPVTAELELKKDGETILLDKDRQ
jgi:hypothetical protein